VQFGVQFGVQFLEIKIDKWKKRKHRNNFVNAKMYLKPFCQLRIGGYASSTSVV
jgi:hypothetical protein